MITAFWIALAFLTRLPVPRGLPHGGPAVGRSILMYPLAGLVIGALLGTAMAVLPAVHAGLKAAIALVLWVAVTGALHLDGCADWADAWAGARGRDRDRALALLEDPHVGAMAVVAVVLLLVIKFAALSALLATRAPTYALAPLILAPVLGRTGVVVLLLTTPYLREGGLGAELAAHLPRRAAIGSAAIALLGCTLGLGPYMVAAALAALYLLRRSMLAHFGGCTGDTLGAAIEGVETAVLVAAAFEIPAAA